MFEVGSICHSPSGNPKRDVLGAIVELRVQGYGELELVPYTNADSE
jgi:hypothetical protein